MEAASTQDEIHIDTATASRWLGAFQAAMFACDLDALEGLMASDALWRDLGVLTWNWRQGHDRSQILTIFAAVLPDGRPNNFELAADRPAPGPAPREPGLTEVFFTFHTQRAHGRARVTLARDAATGAPVMKNLLTQLTGLVGYEPIWPRTDRFDVTHPDVRWHDHIAAQRDYADRDPQVLIVGGGHTGVMTAANLARLGVDALIVDKQPRVGDAWRCRYESLLLHQPHGMLYFPFLRYPESYPEYIPKDKFADWFEAYVEMFDLNFWTSAELVSARFDENSGCWTANVRRDGQVRVMHPKHIVLTTGGTSLPRVPDYPGLDDFAGQKLLADEFKTGADFAGKRVLVVGVGVTAHDYAQDIVRYGGMPTLLQRGPQCVVDLHTSLNLYGDYNGRLVPTELVDERRMAGSVLPMLLKNSRLNQAAGEEADHKLLSELENAGMKLWSGRDGNGWFFNFLESYGGYYINVGASEMIIEGKIKILQAADVERFVPAGVLLKTGVAEPFDAVVYASGYLPPIVDIQRLFGVEVATNLGQVWGLGPDGEINNVWKPTAQQNLWIGMGGIPNGRYSTPSMAVMIQADLEGVTPKEFKTPGHPSLTPTTFDGRSS